MRRGMWAESDHRHIVHVAIGVMHREAAEADPKYDAGLDMLEPWDRSVAA